MSHQTPRWWSTTGAASVDSFHPLSLVHDAVHVPINAIHCRHEPRIGYLPRIDGKDGTRVSRGTRRSKNGEMFTARNGLVYCDFLATPSTLLGLRITGSKRRLASSHGLSRRLLRGTIAPSFDRVGERYIWKLNASSTRHTMQNGVGVWTRYDHATVSWRARNPSCLH